MALDDVVHTLTPNKERFKEATDRTVRWLDRCIVTHLAEKKNRYKTFTTKKNLKKRNRNQRQEELETGYQKPPALFGILQGCLDCDPKGLRQKCLDKFLKPDTSMNPDDDNSFLKTHKELLNLKQGEIYNRKNYIDGYAIGGLAGKNFLKIYNLGGESKEDYFKVVDFCCRALPEDRPRYVMGVGYPVDIVLSVCFGADQFDCV